MPASVGCDFCHWIAASLEAQMKSTKSPRSALAPKKKVKKRNGRRRPNLDEQYREVQWLRDLVKYLEQFDEGPRRK